MEIIIIGAGASGLMCAVECCKNTLNKVTILEGNEKAGKKIYITGKGRCNVCNDIEKDKYLNNVVNNSKFLFASINKFSPQDTINFFEENGTPLKKERGNRIFPLSDKASDITNTLLKAINKNATIKYNTLVESVKKEGEKFKVFTNKGSLSCDALVIATGGKSYSSTGSKGDGYKFAKTFSHTITPIKPALVPIKLKNFNADLSGLSLKNVTASIIIDATENENINSNKNTNDNKNMNLKNSKEILNSINNNGNKNNINNENSNNKNARNIKTFSEFGEMLFTHNGVSGPIILTLSSFINTYNLKNSLLSIDLKPNLSVETLENRLLRDFSTFKTKQLKNYLKELMPSSLINVFMEKANLQPDAMVCNLTKEHRQSIIKTLKNLSFEINCLEDIEYAIITSGGVNVKEINPKNMESKLVKNLFFVGEVLDLDALTGGFNLQIAFSTGFMAGNYLKELN